MKTTILFLLFTIVTFPSIAQEVKEPVNSGEVILKGIKLHDAKDYEGALEFYDKVPRNDTNYAWALYEKSSTLFSLKKYEEAIKISRMGLDLKTEYDHNFYVTLGNALDESGEKEEALKVFDEGIKRFPMNLMILFNKAITLQKQEKSQEAVDALKHCLRLNPLHPGTHLSLGSIAILEGKVVQAMLALNAFLLLEPYTERARTAVGMLNDLTAEKLDVESKGVVFSKNGDDFSELEVLLMSRVAMNKKYKVPVKLSYTIVKQNHLLFSQLKEMLAKKKDGFFTEFYAPFFVAVLNNNYFDEFTLFELMTVDDKTVQGMIKKQEANIKKFVAWAGDEYRKFTRKHNIQFDGKNQVMDHYYYKTKYLEAIGNSNPTTNLPIGKWLSYQSAGTLGGTQFYTEDGKRDGTWQDFYIDGTLKAELSYKNGIADGFYKFYFPNGKLKLHNDVKNDKIDGLARDYFFDGTINAETNFKEGVRSGSCKIYHPINSIKYELNYANDLLNGSVKEYYPDGKLKMTGVYKDGKMTGEFLNYWPNGKLMSKYTYANDMSNGPFENYYDNGQLKDKGSVKNGTVIGVYTSWYRNGKLDEEHEYDENGKGNGVQKEYDEDGILYFESETRKDIMINYKYFDKAGKIISQGKEERGVLHYVFHYPDGEKHGEGDLKKGLREGVWKYYDRMGNLDVEEKYSANVVNEVISFHRNGKIESKSRYKEGERDGLYESFFNNGKPNVKGWFTGGQQNGYWYYYNNDGSLRDINYYINGEEYGIQESYGADGKLESTTYVDEEGFTVAYTYFDSTGNAYEKIDFSSASGELVNHHLNGKVHFRGNYKINQAHGKFEWFYANGQKQTEGQYFAGKNSGEWKWYHDNGQLETVGYWFNGDRDSVWHHYYPDGTLRKKSFYALGEQTGVWEEYYDNGQLAAKKTYVHGERHGPSYYYAEDGMLRMIKEFSHEDLIAVTYPLPNGQMSEPIKVRNETIVIKTYFKNGKMADQFTMEKNDLSGEYIQYHSNGKVAEKSNFVEGWQEGKAEYFFSSGKIKALENYYHSNLNGLCKYYEENGNLKSELSYVLDELHGPCKYYKNGKLVKTRIYYNGKIISEVLL